MLKLKNLLLSPLIVASVIANIASVDIHDSDLFHKNEHVLHVEKRQYLRSIKNNLSGSNKAKRRIA